MWCTLWIGHWIIALVLNNHFPFMEVLDFHQTAYWWLEAQAWLQQHLVTYARSMMQGIRQWSATLTAHITTKYPHPSIGNGASYIISKPITHNRCFRENKLSWSDPKFSSLAFPGSISCRWQRWEEGITNIHYVSVPPPPSLSTCHLGYRSSPAEGDCFSCQKCKTEQTRSRPEIQNMDCAAF